MTVPAFTHIEFCGLAASGKSTAASVLLDLLRRRGAAPVTAADLPRLAAARHRGGILGAILPTSLLRWTTPDMGVPALGRFIASRPALLSAVAEALSQPDMSDDDRRAAATSLFHTATYYQLASESLRAGETLLLEEGFAHRGLTTFGYRLAYVPEELVRRYAEVVPCPALVVAMDTPVPLCVERVRSRRAPPRRYMSAMSATELADCFARAGARLNAVLKGLQERGSRVIRINGSGRADDLRDALSSAVPPSAPR